MIVLLHTNYYSLGDPCQEDVIISPISTFWKILAEQICIVGVNVFIFISGWFGIRPSFKGLCSLLFQVFFWGSLILFLGLIFHVKVPVSSIAQLFWFGSYYWFVIAYIGLYLLAPVLNSYIDHSSPKQLMTIIIGLFSMEFVYGWLTDTTLFNMGYSIVSFIGLYLLARYIRLYSKKLKLVCSLCDILLYLFFTIFPATISFFGIRNGWPQLHPLYYSSPFVIAASVFLFLAFTKKDFNNKAINWIACSTFSVYLVHLHPVIAPYFKSTMSQLALSLSPCVYSCLAVAIAVGFLLSCAIFDKVRIVCWNFICSLSFDKAICNRRLCSLHHF